MGVKVFYAWLMGLFLMTIPVFAQQQPPSAGDIVARMQSQLNLTQDQSSAITPIIEKYTSKREELRQGVEDGTVERSNMRAQMKQMREDEKQELSQILSADQVSQWDALMKSQMHRHPAEGGSAPEGGAVSPDGSSNHEGSN